MPPLLSFKFELEKALIFVQCTGTEGVLVIRKVLRGWEGTERLSGAACGSG